MQTAEWTEQPGHAAARVAFCVVRVRAGIASPMPPRPILRILVATT